MPLSDSYDMARQRILREAFERIGVIPEAILPPGEKTMMFKEAEPLNVVCIGGPLDGRWTKVDPSVEYYTPTQNDLKESGQTYEKPKGSALFQPAYYERKFLKWGSKTYLAFIWSDVKDEDLLPTLLRGYGGKPTAREIKPTTHPTGRSIDLTIE